MQVKVLCWNIWLDGDIGGVIEFIKNVNADIVGLQEVVPERTPDIVESIKALGYHGICAPVLKMKDGNTLSNAIFGKFPILEKRTHILTNTQTHSDNPYENEKRIAVEAEFDVGETSLHAFSTHLAHTHQKQSDIQDAQVQALLKATPRKRTIVMGDFNATPDSRPIQMMKKSLTMADDGAAPTWCQYAEGCPTCNFAEINTRLDYIFTTPDLKTHSFKVEQSPASDHLPFTVVLEV